MQQFSEWIKTLRERKGWNQNEAASESGVSAPYISLMERGRKIPSASMLRKLAKAYGVDEDEVVNRAYPTESTGAIQVASNKLDWAVSCVLSDPDFNRSDAEYQKYRDGNMTAYEKFLLVDVWQSINRPKELRLLTDDELRSVIEPI